MIFLELFEAIKNRRSIRAFKSDSIPEEDLKKILTAGIWAPSAGNLQSWEFIIVKDDAKKKELAIASYGQDHVHEAPVVIAICANKRRSSSRYGERGKNLYCVQDTAAAIQNILLMAHALGYGTCWVGAFNEKKVAQILDCPDHIRPVALIPLGVPAEHPIPPSRMDLNKVTYAEKFGQKYY